MWCVIVVVGCGMSMCHKLVDGDMAPWRIVFPLKLMFADCLSKVALQPALQSCAMEISEFCRVGMMCAVVAVVGSDGCSGMVALWLELVSAPFGSLIVIVVFGDRLVVGVSVVRK